MSLEYHRFNALKILTGKLKPRQLLVTVLLTLISNTISFRIQIIKLPNTRSEVHLQV